MQWDCRANGHNTLSSCSLWVAFTAHVPRTFKVQLAYVVVANLTKKRRVGGSRRQRSTYIGGISHKSVRAQIMGKAKCTYGVHCEKF